MDEERFEKYLCEKNDRIDNAAFELINALVSKSTEPGETAVAWDMTTIGEVIDMVESYLNKDCKIKTCHPYYAGNNRTPCFKSDCTTPGCPLRQKN